MLNQDRIRHLMTKGMFEFSAHALKRVVERDISEQEICEAGGNIEIIENYPEDKYSPSCLCLGLSNTRRPLHIQVCFSDRDLLKIVTVYEPDPGEWRDGRIRRPR
jgi:hypothetical protein